MTNLNIAQTKHSSHPLDIIERIVDDNDWISDRRSDQEMAVQVPGHWCDYSMFFAWNDAADAIHFTCAFDMRVPAECRDKVHELLVMINEKLWLGHFGVWDDEGLPMYRHALPLRGTDGPSQGQMEDMVETALMECERFYPAFQYVIWGGKSAIDSIAAAMVDTVGEA
ncbi:MAG: YbjN domain-containing protein [Rhodospirillaceae bacterium]|nr:YbjN domain-containing protein [Rhodospirillaceae bacterium]MBL6930106.1 YbjN domain-containing protein [Rhodospirillales bacterium]MBL6940733.1 YbjN domain-containing protein [Rhodospirillales bacterium]